MLTRAVALSLAATAALTGCGNDASEPSVSPQVATTTVAPSVTATGNGRTPDATEVLLAYTGRRRDIPQGDDPCNGAEPPFTFGYLPTRFSAELHRLQPGREGGEPYDPTFYLVGPGEQRLDLYHGNSWRLAPIPEHELVVLQQRGVLSRFEHSGDSIVEFPVTERAAGCDWWGIAAVNVTRGELEQVVDELRSKSN